MKLNKNIGIFVIFLVFTFAISSCQDSLPENDLSPENELGFYEDGKVVMLDATQAECDSLQGVCLGTYTSSCSGGDCICKCDMSGSTK